jgi:His-Xaa-Ser system radical SAM maturase HxsC
VGGAMIALRARAEDVALREPLARSVFLLVDADSLTSQRRGRAFLVTEGSSVPDGFALYLTKRLPSQAAGERPAVALPPLLHHLEAGDIVSLSADGERIRVLWRHRSHQNSVLLTERCDHYCLMCSQPPKERDDDWLLDDATELVRLLPRTTTGIGFTGGEPTIYGERLVELLRLCRNLLPFAGVHVLSNGRRFDDLAFASAYASVENPNMMVGIPLYGAEPSLHDYVVQAQGAFDDTVRGILHLGSLGQRIELRVVVHRQTAPHLVEIADFIARNLPFVEQVALMGLETTGFARANLASVWIDPTEYQEQLVEAVRRLDRRRVRTMIYNHQLCLLDRELWPFAVRSISDWKNEYHPECDRCAVVDACGGFFASARYRVSEHIRALDPDDLGRERALLSL